MADTVRYLLEEMVPELEALEERGYFSRDEIRAIVQRRQDFEYALKRMAARREDYLRYIAYESQLDELREARRASRGISGKRGFAEWCITRRIHFVYERATRKFRGDLDLWSRWLRFCRASRSARQMSRALTKALQLHSSCAPLWAYAAAWELEHNGNAGAARALMQRGLRMCKHAPQLWHEYFRLELLYALRLRERRRVLGIDDGGGGGGKADGGDQGGSGSEEEEGDESAAAVAAVLNGAVAGVVLRAAVAAVPGDISFRARFLDLLAPLAFPGRAALEEAVYEGVARDFGAAPEAVDLLARRPLRELPVGAAPAARLAAAQAAAAVYEEALSAAPSTRLAAALLDFLQEQAAELDAAAGGGGGDGKLGRQAAEAVKAAQWLRLRAQRAYEEAGAAGLMDEGLWRGHVAFLLRNGDVEPALATARAATTALPQSAALWQQLLALQAQLAAEQVARGGAAACLPGRQPGADGGSDSSSEEEDEEEEGVRQPGAGSLTAAAAAATRYSGHPALQRLEASALVALRSVPAVEAPPLWLAVVGLLCGAGCSLQGLAREMVQAALRQPKGPVQGGLGAAAAALLTALAEAGGVEAARALVRALLPLPPPGGDFFRAALRLEMAEQGGHALPPARLQELFEAAIAAYGAVDPQLWLLCCEWHAGRGAAAQQAATYWRARKALGHPEAFEAAYLLRFRLLPHRAA